MYLCATILLFVSLCRFFFSKILVYASHFSEQSYLIGLWFSLRTHASQIWQNPQQLLHPMELPTHTRMSLYNKLVNPNQPPNGPSPIQQPHRRPSNANTDNPPSRPETSLVREASAGSGPTASASQHPISPSSHRKVSYASPQQPNVLESVAHAVKNTDLQKMQLPQSMTTDDFTRAVAVATVSALRHQQTHAHSSAKVRTSGAEHEVAGGHDAPSWSRTTSASVLLACTFLYALIAGKLAMGCGLC